MKIFDIYFTGIFVLVLAIIVNPLVNHFGILTWYEFGASFFTNPIRTISSTKWLSLVWLFLVYPITLGYASVIGRKCFLLITS